MKGIDIFYASQASTSICSSMDIEQEASSSSSSSSLSSAANIQLGGRTLDRINPIICDGKRNINTSSTNTLLTPPRNFSHPPISPQSFHQLTKSKKNSSKPHKKTNLKNTSPKQQNHDSLNIQSTDIVLKKKSIPTDIVTKSFAKLNEFIAPPPPPTTAGSSRYLLGSDSQSQFFDGLPEFEQDFDLVPVEDSKDNEDSDLNQNYESPSSSSSRVQGSLSQPPKPSTPPNKQVVVLMVSLHCKGCEGKVRKHLSKMEGVTSFKIDYAAKQVTIEGDVTPVSLLASLSKLKHAKFWTSTPTPSPSPPPPPPPSTSLMVDSTSNQLD